VPRRQTSRRAPASPNDKLSSAVTPDGSRFVVVRTPPDRPEYVVVVGNWLQNVRAGFAAAKR
jgi:hypothetical protein